MSLTEIIFIFDSSKQRFYTCFDFIRIKKQSQIDKKIKQKSTFLLHLLLNNHYYPLILKIL